MKKQVKKLRSILKEVEQNENKRAAMLVYLSVVLLGKKFKEVSKYFSIPEVKVQSGVSKMQGLLNSKTDSSFYLQMHKVFNMYNSVTEIKLVA